MLTDELRMHAGLGLEAEERILHDMTLKLARGLVIFSLVVEASVVTLVLLVIDESQVQA